MLPASFVLALFVVMATTPTARCQKSLFTRVDGLDDLAMTEFVLDLVQGDVADCGVACALHPLCVGMSLPYAKEDPCRLYGIVKTGSHPNLTSDPGARYFLKPGVTVPSPSLISLLQQNRELNGVYDVTLPDGSRLPVYLETTDDGKHWVVVLRRQDGSEDFYRDWEDYAQGFGNLTEEFWIGNEHLHALTAAGLSVLRVDLENAQGGTGHSVYSSFRVDDSSTNYTLTVSGFDSAASNAGDAMAYHNGMPFSTRDRDNSKAKCAEGNRAGWWYKACYHSLLTGHYYAPGSKLYGGLNFHSFESLKSLRRAEMKLRLPQ